MTTFTVPATVEADESPVYVAVAGEPDDLHTFITENELDVDPGSLFPPSALVALLDPCKTCGGDGVAGTSPPCPHRVEIGWEPMCPCVAHCPDCHGSGSTLVTLQQECTHPHEELGCVGLPSCDRNGIVSLPGPYRLTELLPVVGDDQSAPVGCSAFIFEGTDGEWVLFRNDQPVEYITVHGTPEPGGYIAVFEKVDG